MKRLFAFFGALLFATAAFAQGTGLTGFQFPSVPWQSYAPGRVQCGWLNGANFNTTADQKITLMVPTSTYMIDQIVISAPSVSMTTAAGGFYSAASKGGIAVVASTQTYTSLTTNAANTTGNAMLATLATAGNTTEFTIPTTGSPVLYLSLTTAQGAAATANVRIFCRPQYPVT
jgi:hypothetical protein